MLLTLLVTKLFAAMPFFSGYAGLLTNLSLDENGADFDPTITTETFFNGQLDFSGVFILRGEFFLQTTDITNQNLFDDAFSALDFKTDYVLRRELANYSKGTTKLIVASRIGTIMDADKIVVLENGKLKPIRLK